jgi:hypothetical protein
MPAAESENLPVLHRPHPQGQRSPRFGQAQAESHATGPDLRGGTDIRCSFLGAEIFQPNFMNSREGKRPFDEGVPAMRSQQPSASAPICYAYSRSGWQE